MWSSAAMYTCVKKTTGNRWQALPNNRSGRKLFDFRCKGTTIF